MDRIAEGITLEDGEIHADEIAYVKDKKQEIGIEIHSGSKPHRTPNLEFLGYEVKKLDRVLLCRSDEEKSETWRLAIPYR